MIQQQWPGPQTAPAPIEIELPGQDKSTYGNDAVTEIDLPGADNASPAIPEEFPCRGA